MARVWVEQDDLNALSYAHKDIAGHLESTVANLESVLSEDQIGPLKDAHTRLASLSTAVLEPTSPVVTE